MKTKKIISFALAMIMLLSITITASAQRIVHDGDFKHVTVTYGVDMEFIVTIPANIQINAAGIGSAEITASNVFLPVDRNLEVAVSGDDYVDKWEIINQSDSENKIQYFIYNGAEEVNNNDVVLLVSPGEAYDSTKTTNLTLSIDGVPTTADSYIDTLTFTASLSAKLINFYITFPNGQTNEYMAYDGWTWSRWLASDFNSDEFVTEFSKYDNQEQINYNEPGTNNKWYIVFSEANYDKVFTEDVIARDHEYHIYR